MSALASRPLSSLIEESSTIFSGRVWSAEIDEAGGGVAQIKVREVFKGQPAEKEIELHWSAEVEDQRLSEVGSEWVFFLKRGSGGAYVATQFGRSYFRLTFDMDSEENVIALMGSMVNVEMDLPIKIGKTRILCQGRRPGDRWTAVDSITLEDLARVIRTGTGKR